MKKNILILLVLLTLVLSACSGQAITTGNSSEPQPLQIAQPVSSTSTSPAAMQESTAGTTDLSTLYDGAASIEMQLLLGTLKLVGTAQTVTKDQASTLLPVWTNLQNLQQSMGPGQTQGNSNSESQTDSSATQNQIDELVKQIESLMTPAQIQTIAEMKITQQSAMTLMQELGITMGGPGQTTGSNSSNGNMPQPPQGNPPAGAPSGSGTNDTSIPPAPLSGGQQTGNGQQSGNSQQPGNPSADGMVPPPAIDALIQILQKIASGETVTAVATTSTTNNASAGNPPSSAPAGSDSGNVESGLSTATGTYTLNGGTDTQSSQTYTASNTDQSGVYVTNGGNLTLNNVTVNTSGNTSSDGNSSFFGLNAGVLSASGSTITMNGGTISTTGTGANGAFATGEGTTVNLSDVTINATGDGGHGVMTTLGGAVNLTNVNMTTSGAHSAPIATDRGGGTINATGGTLNAEGEDSPCYYSTGTLNIKNSTCNATGSEVAVIEGSNSVNLTDSNAKSSVADKWGVMIYQSFSGDAQGSDGVFTMTGGSLSYTDTAGPLFYITNTKGTITLEGVNVNAASGTIIKAEGNDRWGISGSNGGTVILVADAQTLNGNLVADKISSITATLQNGSSLTGAINPDNGASALSLTLDSSSTWTVTADSYLSCLSDASGISGTTISNINGNAHTVYYNASLCSQLGGKTYSLSGGGTLTAIK